MPAEIISRFDNFNLLVEEMIDLDLDINMDEYIRYWASCHYPELQQYYINPSSVSPSLHMQPAHICFLDYMQLGMTPKMIADNVVILRSGNFGFRLVIQITGPPNGLGSGVLPTIYSIFEIELGMITDYTGLSLSHDLELRH